MRIDPVQAMTSEKSVLASAMMDPLAVKPVVERLTTTDFQNEANRTIWKAMKKLHGEGKPIDLVTLMDEVGGDSTVNRIGGLDYLVELNNMLATAVHVEHYINLVIENSREDRIARAFNRIIEADEPALLQLRKLVEAEEAMIKPVEAGLETTEAVMAYLEQLCDGKEKQLFMTGLPRFDNDMGGLPRGSVSIMAARPRVGKTALALNVMLHNIYSGFKGAYFSLEMPREQLFDRLGAMTARIPYAAIHKKRLEQGQKIAVSKELADLTTGNRLHVFDNVRSVSGIIAEAGRVKADIVFVDYIQKVHPDERRNKRNEEIESIMDRFKEAAIPLNAHFCVLSQINREGADRPKLEYLKESGAIEEGGDIVMLLHRGKPPGQETLLPNGVLIVAKHKYGEEGAIDLVFDGKHQRFTEAARE